MKTLLLTTITLFSLILFGLPAKAWISTQPDTKEFHFVYHTPSEKYEVKVNAPSYEEALEFAAVDCFNHFTGTKGKVSENRGLAAIDLCVNPRSI